MSEHTHDNEPRVISVWLTLDERKVIVHMLSGCVLSLMRAAPSGNDARADMLVDVIVRLHMASAHADMLNEAEALLLELADEIARARAEIERLRAQVAPVERAQ